ncbi:MAG: hypothetical protein ACQERU_11200 [Bacteroidota bacterium]
MKKSNIILIGLLVIFIVTIVVLQLQIRSQITNIKEIDFSYNHFTKLEVQSGWRVELYNDTSTKVTVNSTDLKNLISLNGNQLVLKKAEDDTLSRKVIKISNSNTKHLATSGNSLLFYYCDSPDSLFLELSDKSNIIIDSKKPKEGEEKKPGQEGKIAFLDFTALNQSKLNIYLDIDELQGNLIDKSSCHLTGAVNFKNVYKSKESVINTWRRNQ